MSRARTFSSGLSRRARDPIAWTDVVQVVKTVLAAVIAWLLAVHVLGLTQPFLAPWAALLTVHATVYRTLSRGVQQVGATVLGVLLAFAAGTIFGVTALALGLVVFIGLGAGTVRGLRSESTTAAATALVVLTTGYSSDGSMLLSRLADTAVGIGVGIVVNLLVLPPLRDRSAARQVDVIDDVIGALLTDMAADLRNECDDETVTAWIDRARALDEDIEHAWADVGQARESGRMNPRRAAANRTQACEDFADILRRLEQAVAEIHSMARSIGREVALARAWDPGFGEPWLALLTQAGEGVSAADASVVQDVKEGVDRLAQDLSTDDLPAQFWPLYGALLINLRNIVDAMEDVAAANPVTGRHGNARVGRAWTPAVGRDASVL